MKLYKHSCNGDYYAFFGTVLQAKYAKNSNSYIFISVDQIDMKFDRPATETSWVVSYGSKTIPRWWMAAISPYLSEKSSNFDEILYIAADFELDERDVIKNEKAALDRLRVKQNVFLVKGATVKQVTLNVTDIDEIDIVNSQAVLEMSSFSKDMRLMSSLPLVNSLVKM